MRVVPSRWDNETWICSLRGHVAPAARVAEVGPADAELGIDTPDGARLSRCLRCDLWVRTEVPTAAETRTARLPERASLPKPRRGVVLEDAIVVRLIAVERAAHSVLFTLLAAFLAVVELDLGGLRDTADAVAESLGGIADNSGRGGSHAWLVRHLRDVGSWQDRTIRVLLVIAIGYAVLEGVEAFGLWRERRWAEYLTVVATVGFLPLEIHELTERVTVVRVVMFVLNLAVLVWLVWVKRLFGVRGGTAALAVPTDWDAILDAPAPPPERARC